MRGSPSQPPALFAQVVDIIEQVPMEDRDTKGDRPPPRSDLILTLDRPKTVAAARPSRPSIIANAHWL
jgi:hypothetical protein